MPATTSLRPPAEALDIDMISTFQRRRSAKRVYMRNRSAANRAASSPPVPARISSRMFLSSLGSLGSSRTLSCSSSSLCSASSVPCSSPGQLAHLGIALQLARLVQALAADSR